jgi:hypothetical protein
MYVPREDGGLKPAEGPEVDRSAPPPVFSGGGGLLSTAADYLNFAQMLLNQRPIQRPPPAQPQNLRSPHHPAPALPARRNRCRRGFQHGPGRWRADRLIPGATGAVRSAPSAGAAQPAPAFGSTRREDMLGILLAQTMPGFWRAPDISESSGLRRAYRLTTGETHAQNPPLTGTHCPGPSATLACMAAERLIFGVSESSMTIPTPRPPSRNRQRRRNAATPSLLPLNQPNPTLTPIVPDGDCVIACHGGVGLHPDPLCTANALRGKAHHMPAPTRKSSSSPTRSVVTNCSTLKLTPMCQARWRNWQQNTDAHYQHLALLRRPDSRSNSAPT